MRGQGGRRDSWDGAHGQENDSLPQRKLCDRGALAGIQSNACIMSLYLAYALAHVSDAVMAFSVWLWWPPRTCGLPGHAVVDASKSGQCTANII